MSVKQVLKEVLFGQKPVEQTQTFQSTQTLPAQTLQSTQSAQTLPAQTYQSTQTLPVQQNLQVKQLPPDVQVEKRTPVIREVIHPFEKHEVNPIIYREREQMEVRQIEQPIYETVRRDAQLLQKDLPPETRPVVQNPSGDFDMRYQEGLSRYKSSVEYAPMERDTITKPPVVIETIRKHIREEIQPVIYRETYEPHVIQETLPIYEKVVEQPILSRVSQEPIVQQVQSQPRATEFVHKHGDYVQRPAEWVSRPQEFATRQEFVSRPTEYVTNTYQDLGGKKASTIEITETSRPSSWGNASS